jgi:uncharacterized protein (DUF58 family)
VRTAFSSLTTRGRAFVVAGATAVVSAVLVGLDDLTRIGALLLVLPLITAVVLTRGQHRLTLSRTVTPHRLTAGQTATVELDLRNEGRVPTGLLLLEEQVPYALGVRPRFVVDRMGARWHRTVSYVVRSDVRGRFTLGPMEVHVHDPFGLVELDRTFTSTADLVVTPKVVPLPAIPLEGVWTGSGDNRPRDFVGGSAEDVTVREYRRGDDLRRVHWRSSAHAGELMVRREEQPWQSRATLFVDNRRHAHRGTGLGSSFEYAVVVAASIGLHLAQRGFRVRLVTAEGHDTDHRWHEHAAGMESGPLLESLALLGTVNRTTIDTSWLSDAHQSGLHVAVVGDTLPTDRAALSRMRHAASTPLAIALDVEQWQRSSGPVPQEPAALGLLTATGWRAVATGPQEPLAGVWQQLGLLSRRGRSGVSSPAPPAAVPQGGGAGR